MEVTCLTLKIISDRRIIISRWLRDVCEGVGFVAPDIDRLVFLKQDEFQLSAGNEVGVPDSSKKHILLNCGFYILLSFLIEFSEDATSKLILLFSRNHEGN